MTIVERQKLVDARRRRLLRPQIMSPAIGLGHCDGCEQTTFLADLTSLRRESDPPSTKLCSRCLEARHEVRERRSGVRLLTVQPQNAANENEAAETHEHRFTRVGYSGEYGVLYECIECGCEPVVGLDSARLPSGPSSVSSADVVWSWDHTSAMGLAEMTNAAMRRIEEAVQR